MHSKANAVLMTEILKSRNFRDSREEAYILLRAKKKRLKIQDSVCLSVDNILKSHRSREMTVLKNTKASYVMKGSIIHFKEISRMTSESLALCTYVLSISA